MKSSNREDLWKIFLEKYEPEFKNYLGYGKDEIEKIGTDKFFDVMGWTSEEDFESYKTDMLHVIPCLQCKEDFAIFETNYGLCDKCQEGYNLDEFAAFTDSIRSEQGEKAVNDILGAFYSSEEYRDCFKIKDADTPEFAWVSVDNKSWRLVPLQELLKSLSSKIKNHKIAYQIVLHDQSFYKKDGKDTFNNLEVAMELAKKYPNIFQHKNT